MTCACPRTVLLAVLCGAALTSSLAAGPLTPPVGAVTSSFKTLSEVEPRIAINATNTPGDADSVFRITQPGSYYLTGSVTGQAGKKGIELAASGVTIDLNGFELVGVPTSLCGIERMLDTGGTIVIRNGGIRGWGLDGIRAFGQQGVTVESVQAFANAGSGIAVGNGAIVRHSTAIGNVVYGIRAGDTCVVEGCTAVSNTNVGILAAQGSIVRGCASKSNGSNGIEVGQNSTVVSCTVRFNAGIGLSLMDGSVASGCTTFANSGNGIEMRHGGKIMQCASEDNGGHGIAVSSDAVVEGCNSSGNIGSGIVAASNCTIVGNTSTWNGKDAGDGAGIATTGVRNRIEGNACAYNDRGIDVAVTGSFIARNRCGSNTKNWQIASGNICLVVIGTSAPAINGNSGGVAPGSTDPNANFTF